MEYACDVCVYKKVLEWIGFDPSDLDSVVEALEILKKAAEEYRDKE